MSLTAAEFVHSAPRPSQSQLGAATARVQTTQNETTRRHPHTFREEQPPARVRLLKLARFRAFEIRTLCLYLVRWFSVILHQASQGHQSHHSWALHSSAQVLMGENRLWSKCPSCLDCDFFSKKKKGIHKLNNFLQKDAIVLDSMKAF